MRNNSHMLFINANHPRRAQRPSWPPSKTNRSTSAKFQIVEICVATTADSR